LVEVHVAVPDLSAAVHIVFDPMVKTTVPVGTPCDEVTVAE
jgi:hypothetical protein